MSFMSGGGGSAEMMPMYMPGESPPEQEARRAQQESRGQANAMLEETRRQTDMAVAETGRLRGIEADTKAKADKEAADEETRRQSRIAGGGLQRFMTAGYTGYGDSRPLGTALTLGS
jgi:hypothetical protein